ncbi:MAG: hypothetical protein QME51_10575 [Planctomycetota bacterium]|nr:hypothetical protein [Planctomycetota bacterium]
MDKDNAEKTPELLAAEKKAAELQAAQDLLNKEKQERADPCLKEIQQTLTKYRCKLVGFQVRLLSPEAIGINVVAE